ncbi:MAG: TadE family protein [Actinomycetales bacterium]|nr:TadE family protein [Actinomycetales bacterium]
MIAVPPAREGLGRRDEGSVTAELAVALPAVVVVLLLVLGLGTASMAQVRAVDAARTAARLAAIGDDDAALVAAAQRLAGDGSHVGVVREPPWVTVSVRVGVVAGFEVGASASAWVEP